MTTKLKLISILFCIITLQSCSKEPHFIKLPDDKLLLSNASGTFVDANWYGINAFEFNNQGMFNTSFVYGQKVSGSLKYRPLEKVQFIPTEYNANGNWDFVYHDHYLTHISDSTYPPRFGKQWVFSYNDKHQIEETKIINTDDFSIATYEHFVYNEKYQVVELKYGLSKKEIYYKVNYPYDNWGNLLSFACYFNDVDFGTSNKGSGELLSAPANLKGTITPALINKKLQELLNSKRQGHRSVALTDNYVLLFNATITSDNANNPFRCPGSPE